jgi:HNH endonuclease
MSPVSAHDKASQGSRVLCDLLLSLVSRQVARTTRHEAIKCCSVGVTTRFAYAYHRRDGLRVYLYGKEADGPELKALAGDGLEVLQRRVMKSAWARLSPYYLEIDSERAMRAAIPLFLYAAARIGKGREPFLWPSEDSSREMTEGARMSVQVSRVERDPVARSKCIKLFGTACSVCGFDFERAYGQIGSGFIHVHHLNPLASTKGRRTVNPQSDLRPVCPNCHEMLHRRNPPFGIDEMKSMLRPARP